MVTVKNLCKSFGKIKAVDDLSFSVKSGEIVGLLGPNGAGKTTTMRLITGFLAPDSGEILINGVSVLESPLACQKEIGYLPENNPLYPQMLVSEFLNFFAELKGLSPKNKKEALDFAVESTGLENVYYRQISQLSKGFKQRVGLATCILNKPSVLIMDEPTEGLDPNQRSEIRQLIKKLSTNRTVIVSTHVMQEVEAICNRLIIINRGKLVADGTPNQLTKFASQGQQIVFEVEGKNIQNLLSKIEGIENIQIKKEQGKILSLVLSVKKGAKIQPAISKLATKNGWIIWKLTEEEKPLEEVFHLLTQAKEEK